MTASGTGEEVTYTMRSRGCRSRRSRKRARSSMAWTRVPVVAVECSRLTEGTTTTDSSAWSSRMAAQTSDIPRCKASKAP